MFHCSAAMATRAFILYLLSGFFLAVLSVFFLPDFKSKNDIFSYQNNLQSPAEGPENVLRGSVRVWPDLEFNWKSAVATIVGFLGSAFGTVGGVGGGGIFVPMLTLIVGFDAKSAAALSKCMIMGASASSVWYNLRLPHPTKDVPIIDYDLALLFQPMLMLGITIGVELSVIFPYWLVTVLIIVLFIGTSSRSFMKGIEMWKEETIIKKEMAKLETRSNSNEQVVIDADYHALLPEEEKSGLQMLLFNIKWKGILLLLVVWSVFLALQILKNDAVVCSPWYWVITVLQFPVAFSVFLYEAVKLYRECKKRKMSGNPEAVCGASIEWNVAHLAFSALCGILGGTVGGLLGSGGGFILGPLLLEFGVVPQAASATATFVMMFSSSLSVVEFYLLKRFPMSYALYLIVVSVLAGFWGQCFIRKLVTLLKRASLIIFVLSAVIFASALTMGVIGVETSVRMIKQHQYMGFLQFCER